MNHIKTQVFDTPSGKITDGGKTITGDTAARGEWVVNANGGGANAIMLAFTAASLKSLILKSDVACVVTLTGATVINGITIGTVTLEANVAQQVTAITGDVTAVSIGANTVGSGPAGTLVADLLYNA